MNSNLILVRVHVDRSDDPVDPTNHSTSHPHEPLQTLLPKDDDGADIESLEDYILHL